MANDFKQMIQGYFGEQVSIERRAPGSFVDGVWQEGAETSISAFASVQPAKGSQIEFLPENQRTGKIYVAYVDTEIFTSRASTAQNSDIIVWRGTRYKVLSVGDWLPTQVYYECMIAKETEA